MKSRSTSHLASTRAGGFTLIEVAVVMAIVALLISLGLFMSMESYRGSLSRESRATLVTALSVARGRALANLYQSPHGVCYEAPNFIVFRGAVYSGSTHTESLEGSQVATLTSTDDAFSCSEGGVVFSQLSATSTGVEITLTEPGRPDASVSVNTEGAILW